MYDNAVFIAIEAFQDRLRDYSLRIACGLMEAAHEIQDNGSPFKMDDGLNQYFPDWNHDVDNLVAEAVIALLPRVKDDVKLGSDITDLSLDRDAHLTAAIQGELTGKVWYRHDGMTAVDHGSAAFLNLPVSMDFRQKNGETGLVVSRPRVGQAPDGRVQITFDNVANWFLRFF